MYQHNSYNNQLCKKSNLPHNFFLSFEPYPQHNNQNERYTYPYKCQHDASNLDADSNIANSPTPPITNIDQQVPQSLESSFFMAGYLKKFIGRDIRIEFLIGSSGPLIDRIGKLLEVGASFITIRPLRSNDILVCDLYSIKFVTVFY